MTIHYLDPSAWVKRHFQEDGSEAVNSLFRSSMNPGCSRLGLVEMLATVARKAAQVSLNKSATDLVIENIRADFEEFRVVPVDDSLINLATGLALRHRLRTMDALHLASAKSLQSLGDVVVVSADSELLAAAINEGLKIINPADSKS